MSLEKPAEAERIFGLAVVRTRFCRQAACERSATGALARELPTAKRRMHPPRRSANVRARAVLWLCLKIGRNK